MISTIMITPLWTQPDEVYSFLAAWKPDNDFIYTLNALGTPDEIKTEIEERFKEKNLKLTGLPSAWGWQIKNALRDKRGFSPEYTERWTKIDEFIAERNKKRGRKTSV